MDVSHSPSILDQLFDALDRGDDETARFRLSAAMDRAKRRDKAQTSRATKNGKPEGSGRSKH